MSGFSFAGSGERYETLDVVRGFAALGILAINAQYFAAIWQTGLNPGLAPLPAEGPALWSWLLPHVALELKCVTLFSMLFGASVLLVGGEGGDVRRQFVLARRLFWLLVIGLLHALFIWYGDILTLYALCGAVAALARGWAARALLIWGVAIFIVVTALDAAANIALSDADIASFKNDIWTPIDSEVARVNAAFSGGIGSATAENIDTWLAFFPGTLTGFAPRTIGMMLIGMGLLKLGFWQGARGRGFYWTFVVLGLAALGVIGAQAWTNAAGGFDYASMMRVGTLANEVLSPFASLGYAAALILIVKAGALRWLTGALGAVGKMAFTNYLTQSLIMTTLFWGGRGFGLFGSVDRPALMGIVAIVWAVQIAWSIWWLKHFNMGPLEWVWRRLSYGEAPPMRRVRV